ncbi:Crp/Fnr family transcriptional regulator [Qipengyuania sp. MTN3-11]|uniref:Crp/Fnr family transcriptional regulator n=1 Tax=Qipengyuania sp. MTN3-11 TaxID=3056557 RepID=UPI0036F40612
MQRVADPVECRDCPLQDCPGLRRLEPDEIAYLQTFKQGEVIADRGERIIEQGQRVDRLFTLLDGLLIRFRALEDGRRQIVNFMFPGDLVGLQGAFQEPATHSVEPLLPSRLCVFERHRFHALTVDRPELGFDLTWLAAKEETALEEHIVALGRRSARERVTYLAVWLLDRALGTCMATGGNRLSVSITQAQIADMLGLSLVHTNRTIKALEREGLVYWNQREISVPDMTKASDFANFDRQLRRPRPFI